eukprot:scaffold9926_cov117-Isochrysis_galbana.AAC.2
MATCERPEQRATNTPAAWSSRMVWTAADDGSCLRLSSVPSMSSATMRKGGCVVAAAPTIAPHKKVNVPHDTSWLSLL